MSHFKKVGVFMNTFGQDVNRKFTDPGVNVTKLRLDLILEEFIELFEATTTKTPNMIATLACLKSAKSGIADMKAEDVSLNHVDIADALTDIEYVTLGAGHAFGVNLDECFEEVQRSNMSKLGVDGKPIYRSDGKVMKGPNYFKPDLGKVLIEAGCYSYGDRTS